MSAKRNYQFTSESVTEGHPDKLCDQVSDAVLDAHLREDPFARVACECCATTGLLLVMGEITSKAQVDVQALARSVVRQIGYTRAKFGFDADTSAVVVSLSGQSPDIAMGVDSALESKQGGARELGAGDQGMMFGFACDDTPEHMPLPLQLSHRLTRELAALRRGGVLPWLRPDGKAQVTVRYEDGRPACVDAVVVSAQHDPDIPQRELRDATEAQVIRRIIPAELMRPETKIYVNPTGQFVIGGPQGDSGLTGRKIIVDTYGGYARHGGGCFSGKDPTKVDRSAAYMARYAARNVVAAGLARRCEIELAYAIGVAHPVSLLVDTAGTGVLPDEQLSALIALVFDFRPAAIIEALNLRRPIYRQTAAYGHFGRDDLQLPWEATDRVSLLRERAGR